MKRRFANSVPGEYKREHINTDYFNGYVCYTKIKNVEKPLIVNNGIYEICLIKDGYEWFQLYSDDENYVLTIMLDENQNIIQWYFDISKNIGIENGIPYEDDMYLDLVITREGNKLILDEDELLDAYNSGEITSEDVDDAYRILKYLEDKYYSDVDSLKEFTKKLINKYTK